MTLHEAIIQVLSSSDRAMTTQEIADELNRTKAYQKRDGSLISAFQIHGRTRNYPQLFERDGSMVRLKGPSDLTSSIAAHKHEEQLVSSSVLNNAENNQVEQLMNEANYKSAASIDTLVPHRPGIYCIRINNIDAFPKPFNSELSKRGHNIIYIGIASQSLNKRMLNQELRANGHGTFFRSLGAVLGYKPPFNSLADKKNKKNYKFSHSDEAKIIEWINENLLVSWVEQNSQIEEIETALIIEYKPLLNISKNPVALSELTRLRNECVKVANGNTWTSSQTSDTLLKQTQYKDICNSKLKLHEAIDEVLKTNQTPMFPREIAQEININFLYCRNDRRPVPSTQISARIRNYFTLFKKLSSGKIARLNDPVKDLLGNANKLINTIRSKFIHDEITIANVHILIPLLFFFKRMVDNPELMNKHLSLKFLITDFNLDKLVSFVDDLNNESNPFYGKLNSLLIDLHHLVEVNDLDEVFMSMRHINLSVSYYSTKDFGKFFNELIYLLGRQNVNIGQFYTPKSVGELVYGLCERELEKDISVYNPAAGFSTIPAIFAQNSISKFNFNGEEIDQNVFLISIMNLISNDIDTETFFNQDTFSKQLNKGANEIAICIPPFKGTYNQPISSIKYKIETKDLVLLFMQQCIQSLKKNGKAVLLIPDGILFNSKRDYKNLRSYILKEKLLECIISLPTGLFYPHSGIKTSLIILSKRNNNEIRFIDAENPNLTKNNHHRSVELNVASIIALYYKEFNLSFQVTESELNNGNKYFTSIPLKKLSEKDANLNLKKYLLKEEDISPDKLELNSFLTEFKGSNSKDEDNLKYVNITDLNNNPNDFSFSLNRLSVANSNQNGRIIDVSALLIGSIVPNVKPTYFTKSSNPIIVSRNILAFIVDTNIVNVEYLIYELKTRSVSDQLKARSTGSTSLMRISTREFLKIRIKVPSIDKQLEIVEIYKESLSLEKKDKANTHYQKKGLTGKSEIELLGFVKHEIGNITGGITNDIVNLQNFVKTKSIDLSEKITGSKKAASLEQVFTRLSNNVGDIENVMTNIQSIIDFGNSAINKKLVYFKRLINKECEKLSSYLKENNSRVFLGVNEKYGSKKDEYIYLDKSQFSFVIRNFIINSVKHGFTQEFIDRSIFINLNIDEDFYYLSLINNGKPFSEGFTMDDFLRFGGRENSTKGSGLGGYLIGKVIENHEGNIKLMKSGTSFTHSEPQSTPNVFIHKDIKIGVHFLIKLPKE